MTSYYALLPEKDNFLRLRDCDFNNKSYNINEIDNSKIPITLKNITNPILILFYYNDTEQRILTEFYLSSKEELEEGNQEDQIFKNFDNKWRKDLIEIENKGIKKEINHDGYYTAIKDDIPVAGVKAGKTYWMKILERAGRYIIEATLIN